MKPANKMSSPPKSGINVQDILYVLFKHKWKIIILSLLGFAAAGGLYYYYNLSPTYETQAKLMVRYVVERRGDPDAPAPKAGGVMMDSELQILTSFDVARDAAEALGPQKVLPDYPGEPSLTAAAAKIYSNLAAETQRGSNVIQIRYRDPDPQNSVEILSGVIQSYFARHLEIHRSTGAFAQVRIQADQARSDLRVTENQINELKSQTGVLSIDTTITEFEARRQQYRSSLMEAQAALAQQRAKVAALTNSALARADTGVAAAGGNDATSEAIDPAQTAEDERLRRQRAEALFEYQGLAARLALLRQERDKMLLQRPPTHPMIQSMDRQISQVQRKSLDLSESYPEFVGRGELAGQQTGPVLSIDEERALEAALEARVKSITDEVALIEGQVESLSRTGFQLADLERRRQMEEEKYRYYQSSWEKAEVDQRLDPSQIPNISIVESPSSPRRTVGEETMKIIMGVAASGLVLGLGLAFLIEFVIDRRVSRPLEIRTRLQLPLMLSIPYIRSRDTVTKLIGNEPELQLLGNNGEEMPPPLPDRAARSRADKNGRSRADRNGEHFIEPFAAAIHDRILFNFEVNGVTHKPKLVALTGLSAGAGTSTIAAGLAKAFAEHGNQKVLLVDLNPPDRPGRIERHPADSLFGALELSKDKRFRESRRNLYFASAPTRRNGNRAHALAPAGLHEIMPHLNASDFDYIVFDMPPVDPTSPTVAMAGFMDKVLLVLDAEDTTRESLSSAYSELEKGRADVSCIFNKARSHAPRWVEG